MTRTLRIMSGTLSQHATMRLIAMWLSALAVCSTRADADDRIVYLSTSGEEVRSRNGTVDGYHEGQFEFTVQGGGQLRVPSSRVVGLEFESSEAWESGLTAWNEGRWEEAFDLLVQAYRSEDRTWARFEIQAVVIRCAYATERYALACQGYLQLVDDDPQTRHFGLIPLGWLKGTNESQMLAQARQWRDSTNPLERLLGASWQLATPEQPAALESLQELSRNADERIAFLARCQSWRPQVPRINRDGLAQWRTVCAQGAGELQAGGQLMIAQAAARLDPGDDAAIEFLKVALDPKAQEALRAEAFLGAARQLRPTQVAESDRLLAELEQKYPESNAWKLGKTLRQAR